MCGIVGYIGTNDAAPIILDGLRRLEYRGYDSAGIALLTQDRIEIRREVGKLANLEKRCNQDPVTGMIGIGHTRWATHGVPAERNAHPHISMYGDYVVVHNGIVENYQELRQELKANGVRFQSETDTEVIAHLVEQYACNGAQHNLVESTRKAVQRLRGAQAIVILSRRSPGQLVATRVGNAGGVAIGIGENGNFIASDLPAILEHTRRIVFLEDRQMATLTAESYEVQGMDGEAVTIRPQEVQWDAISAAKGKYQHFMQKEIFDQARSIADTLGGRIDFERYCVKLPDLNLTAERARRLNRLVTVACGTSYYSALIGKFYIEHLARLQVEVDYGSEYRYRSPLIDKNTAVLAITQSGETVDTLAAMEEARTKHATLWSIVNALGSQAMRVADGHITMNAGPEIGVASTKAFTTSIVDQYLLAVYLGQLRGTLTPDQREQAVRDIAHLPELVSQTLNCDPAVRKLAEQLHQYRDFLYLGRGINYPIALEGALKLKEISYIHAEGYPAGEMKHGPIALIDGNMPVLAIALQDTLYDKMISQIEQARARGGMVIALATEGNTAIADKADHVLYVPSTPALLSPITAVIPLQLLAYHIAVLRGADVDQPRNLAKSVTVE